LKIDCDEDTGRLEISREGRSLLVYSFGGQQFKPYVKELRTLRGANLLLDAPADHLHHHGLMYAIRIDGTNFWEEAKDAGRQEHRRMLEVRSDDTSARFRELLDWRSAGSDRPILTEERELILTVDEPADEVALRWRGRFTVGTAPVKLHGSAYNGLGLRLPPSWDRTALHRNSENAAYTEEQKWDVTRARWAVVSQSKGDERGTVVLFGSPQNAGATSFFSMLNPFAYLSATQSLDLKPMEYGPGEKFEIDYLVLISASEKSMEAIETHYTRWLKENSK
jgi:hypothetical protein